MYRSGAWQAAAGRLPRRRKRAAGGRTIGRGAVRGPLPLRTGIWRRVRGLRRAHRQGLVERDAPRAIAEAVRGPSLADDAQRLLRGADQAVAPQELHVLAGMDAVET